MPVFQIKKNTTKRRLRKRGKEEKRKEVLYLSNKKENSIN
jgi:hypothetical protein